jgi:hypothetical protein
VRRVRVSVSITKANFREKEDLMAELQQPWDSYSDHGLENLSDETDIASVSESESVYSATKSDKNFIAVDDYITPEEPDPSYSLSNSGSTSAQSSMGIAENYLIRHFLVCTGRSTNTSSPLLGKRQGFTSLWKDTNRHRENWKSRSWSNFGLMTRASRIS